ncbi:hypothetical protein [Halopiger xanaduensis]|uniref:Uncharacterized protein n=1 Tax=Halopiger xanaduensis (strain DSM 18323 / JCM 14033 / SH-6) TaxID=797210 RepID=F8DCL7_HALXS|nr:hypothetical protein [Halopiger xanaduensis]AEH36061.1 hypothetical protein Halxa_1428 [Halopiger xanaduensis SH-6]
MRDRLRSLCRRLGVQCPHCASARTVGIPATPGLRRCLACGESFNESDI